MLDLAPETLRCADVVVRPIRGKDENDWLDLRARNRAWLRRWEATAPPGHPVPSMSFPAFVRRDRREWRRRRAINMVIEFEGALVGRVTIGGIEWSAACSGALGYWIDERVAGRGIVPRAVAMITKYGFRQGLHRVEIAARPENEASLRVAAKLGFRDEGRRERYLFIDGAWRDHRVFSLHADDTRFGDFWDCAELQHH